MIVQKNEEIINKLPYKITSLNGININPNDNVWKYRDAIKNIKLDFRKLPVSYKLLQAMKYTFIWYVENLAPSSIANLYTRVLDFLKFAAEENGSFVEKVSLGHVVKFYAYLDDESKYILGAIAGLFKRLHTYEMSVVDDEVISYFKNRKIKGNKKGIPVLIWDHEIGPFSDLEYTALSSALYDAHRNKQISLEDFILGWLFIALGLRPAQYALLRVCDFTVTVKDSGEHIYSLKIPRVKQRNSPSRTEFKDRLLISDVGIKFLEHTNATKVKFSFHIDPPEQAPMFPAAKKALNAPTGYEWHRTASDICAKCNKIFRSLKVNSERTGGLLHVNPTRFRYTTGTRAAVEGHGEYIIAEILDHSDTQNAGVYVKAVPEMVKHFTPGVAKELAPIAAAFKGKVISHENNSDPSKNIYAIEYNSSATPVGSCGKHRRCELFEPLICYTCRSFRPWVNGSHADIMNRLIEDRERILASPSPDLRMATINDLTILAIADVVRRCEEITPQ